MRALKQSKFFRGGAEGSVIVPATLLLGDAIITWVPWFEPRKEQLYAVLGVLVGALLRKAFSSLLWVPSRG